MTDELEMDLALAVGGLLTLGPALGRMPFILL